MICKNIFDPYYLYDETEFYKKIKFFWCDFFKYENIFLLRNISSPKMW